MITQTIITHFSRGDIIASFLNALLVAVVAAPVSSLWNYVAVPLSRLPAIAYRQALGLIVLGFLLKASTDGFKLSANLSESE